MTTYRVTQSPTPIYKYPDTARAELTRLKSGDVVMLVQETDARWLLVNRNEKTGFVERKKVELVGTPTPPASYRFGIIKLDYDQDWGADFGNAFHVSRARRNDPSIMVAKGLPATGRFAGGERIPFEFDLQFWIHSLCGGTPNTYKADFNSLWRDAAFMTNDAGTDGRADYINGMHLDAELPMIEPMGTGGTLLKILSEDDKYYTFAAVNAYGNYRQYSPSTHPWLFFPPTNSKRDFIDGIWYEDISNPFGQYDGKARIPVFAHGDSNTNKIERSRVRILAEGERAPNPFHLRALNPYEMVTA